MVVALLPTDSEAPLGIDTITVRVLPPAPARWHRGLPNLRLAHLRETRNGVPRTLEFAGQPVGISVCGALLGDDEVDPASGLALCAQCEAIAAAVYGATRASCAAMAPDHGRDQHLVSTEGADR
ncbi:hypothetical protein ACTG9Q_32275 [Actinokineospora sp. 24-640]